MLGRLRRKLPPAAALLLAAAASAQTTWFVDPSSAGDAFTTIQAALNAASHRDTIVVRAGTYSDAMQTSKG